MPPNPVLADDCGPCWKTLIILLWVFIAIIMLLVGGYFYWYSHVRSDQCDGETSCPLRSDRCDRVTLRPV